MYLKSVALAKIVFLNAPLTSNDLSSTLLRMSMTLKIFFHSGEWNHSGGKMLSPSRTNVPRNSEEKTQQSNRGWKMLHGTGGTVHNPQSQPQAGDEEDEATKLQNSQYERGLQSREGHSRRAIRWKFRLWTVNKHFLFFYKNTFWYLINTLIVSLWVWYKCFAINVTSTSFFHSLVVRALQFCTKVKISVSAPSLKEQEEIRYM